MIQPAYIILDYFILTYIEAQDTIAMAILAAWEHNIGNY